MSDAMAEATEPWVPEDSFGARLALIRQARGWNVKTAAKICGINPQTWANWEDGTSPRGLDRIARKIAGAAGCDVQWLTMGGPLCRSTCFAPFTLLDTPSGQMELAFGEAPRLVGV